MTGAVEQCVGIVRARAPNFSPRASIVLGSGFGDYADQTEVIAAIPYGDLPGFPALNVRGHASRLILGRVGDSAGPASCSRTGTSA